MVSHQRLVSSSSYADHRSRVAPCSDKVAALQCHHAAAASSGQSLAAAGCVDGWDCGGG